MIYQSRHSPTGAGAIVGPDGRRHFQDFRDIGDLGGPCATGYRTRIQPDLGGAPGIRAAHSRRATSSAAHASMGLPNLTGRYPGPGWWKRSRAVPHSERGLGMQGACFVVREAYIESTKGLPSHPTHPTTGRFSVGGIYTDPARLNRLGFPDSFGGGVARTPVRDT